MYAVLRSKLNLFRKKNSSKMFLSIKRLLKRKKKKKKTLLPRVLDAMSFLLC